MRFGLMSIPGSAREAMAELRTAEEAGFDVIATADHRRHPRDAGLPLLDGWSVTAAWAGVSQRIRIAVLVSNLIIRNPAVLAKQAVTVDQLSGGRLDDPDRARCMCAGRTRPGNATPVADRIPADRTLEWTRRIRAAHRDRGTTRLR